MSNYNLFWFVIYYLLNNCFPFFLNMYQTWASHTLWLWSYYCYWISNLTPANLHVYVLALITWQSLQMFIQIPFLLSLPLHSAFLVSFHLLCTHATNQGIPRFDNTGLTCLNMLLFSGFISFFPFYFCMQFIKSI